MSKSDTPTVVIGMEVLDNLPHDKIRAKTPKRIEQAEVRSNQSKNSSDEIFVPLSDPLLQKVITKVPTYAKPYPCWVPSVACGVIHHLIQQRRNLSLVLADFDWLPAPDLDPSTEVLHKSELAEGEPIVTDMDGIDYECYLTAPSHCDILFPTDFDKLASFAKRSIASSSRQVVVIIDIIKTNSHQP